MAAILPSFNFFLQKTNINREVANLIQHPPPIKEYSVCNVTESQIKHTYMYHVSILLSIF